MFYETKDGYIANLGASENELKHWKYIERRRGSNGRWVYKYSSKSKAIAATKVTNAKNILNTTTKLADTKAKEIGGIDGSSTIMMDEQEYREFSKYKDRENKAKALYKKAQSDYRKVAVMDAVAKVMTKTLNEVQSKINGKPKKSKEYLQEKLYNSKKNVYPKKKKK